MFTGRFGKDLLTNQTAESVQATWHFTIYLSKYLLNKCGLLVILTF